MKLATLCQFRFPKWKELDVPKVLVVNGDFKSKLGFALLLLSVAAVVFFLG